MSDAPRKRPSQERARATVDAILMAAAHILKSQGIERTSTNRIAELAGVSVGSLYQYFPHKHAIVAALRERNEGWFWECLAAEAARAKELPLRPAIRSMVSLLIALHASDPDLHNALATPGGPVDDVIEKLAAEQIRDYLERHPESRQVDPELASFLVVRTLEAVVHDTTLTHPERLRHPQFADEVTELIARYLER